MAKKERVNDNQGQCRIKRRTWVLKQLMNRGHFLTLNSPPVNDAVRRWSAGKPSIY